MTCRKYLPSFLGGHKLITIATDVPIGSRDIYYRCQKCQSFFVYSHWEFGGEKLPATQEDALAAIEHLKAIGLASLIANEDFARQK